MGEEGAQVGRRGEQLPSYTGGVLEGNVGQSSMNGMAGRRTDCVICGARCKITCETPFSKTVTNFRMVTAKARSFLAWSPLWLDRTQDHEASPGGLTPNPCHTLTTWTSCYVSFTAGSHLPLGFVLAVPLPGSLCPQITLELTCFL